jgi:signal transduction histidine kinase
MIEPVLSPALSLVRKTMHRAPEPGDALLTALVMAVMAAGYLVPGLLHWGVGRFLLETASALPLVWRRRHPIPVGLATGGITLLATALVHPAQPFPYAVLISEYTIAAELRGRLRVWTGSLYVVGNIAAEFLHNRGRDAQDFFIHFTMVFAVFLLGMLRQSQQDHTAALVRDRETELERATAVERARIARDMHDIVGHAVALMVVQAEAGPLSVRTHPEKAEAAFDAISAAGRDAMAQLRRLLDVLKDDGGPGPARAPQPTLASLDELVERVRGSGLSVRLEQIGTPLALPADVQTAAYRVVQEALTNTLKHAGASQASVHVGWSADGLLITVVDDGRGLTGHGASSGHGLIGLRERLAVFGGAISWASPPGRPGFVLTASIPAEGW